MGKLVIASRWIKERFEAGSRPKLDQVRGWVESGELAGQIIGDFVYVDADASLMRKMRRQQRVTGLDLLAGS